MAKQQKIETIVYSRPLNSYFPLILSAWKQVGWKAPLLENKIELELQKDINTP